MSLRPIVPQDVPFLYELATSDANGFRWRFRGKVPSPRDFEARLFDQVFQQFVVTANDSNDLIGHVVAYDYDAPNGHCQVAVIMAEETLGSRRGREALDVFVSHLFRASPLRKVYAEVPASTFDGVEQSSDENNYRARFSIEGRLTDHWFIDGRFEDIVIVAVRRSDWEIATGH